MKIRREPYLVAFCVAVATISAIGLLRRDFRRPNTRILSELDMSDSPAYRSQSTNPVFANGKTLQVPPEGTVPRGFVPFDYEAGEEGRIRAAAELTNPEPPSLANLQRGRHVFRNFCQHCHGVAGKGDGGVARRMPIFSMPIDGPSTYALSDGEIFHIVTYGRNNMPGHATQISQADRWRVVRYLRDLQGADYERLAQTGAITHEPDPRPHSLVSVEYGMEIFDGNCAPCHGPEGSRPNEGIPKLNNPRVLAIADEDYYLDIITHGRRGTRMPAWERILTPTQIDSLVAYIRSWIPEQTGAPTEARLGRTHFGQSLYRGNCAPCHGIDGEGGIGNSLRAPSFLSLASEAFLRDTITGGRSHTAMPAGYAFDANEVSDILAYLMSWKKARHEFADVSPLIPTADPAMGRRIYDSKCGSCHGPDGLGGIGASIGEDEWLSMVDDEYLFEAIVRGRPGTAMPSWYHLEAADIADLIAHLRTRQTSPARSLPASSRQGRAHFGRMLYQEGCRSCHGDAGGGGLGNQIANPVFLETASDEFLWQLIAHGKPGTAMRGFFKQTPGGSMMPMSAEDIDHVIAYLRSIPASDVPKRRRSASTADINRGRALYSLDGGCASCHGRHAQGATGPSLNNPEFLASASDGFLLGTIVLGREDTEMRTYHRGGNVDLPSRDIEDVVAFLRSLEGKRQRVYRRLPADDTTVRQGRGLFLRHCAGCHGSEGKGERKDQDVHVGYAPSINNEQFLGSADDGFLQATIALGRPGTPMRAFAKGAGGISDLEPEEIRKIVAYLRSWESEYR